MARPQGTRIRRQRAIRGDGGDHTVRMDRRQGLLGWPERGFTLLSADRQQGLRRGVPRADKSKLGKSERERAANMPRNGAVPAQKCSGGDASRRALKPASKPCWHGLVGEAGIQIERRTGDTPEIGCTGSLGNRGGYAAPIKLRSCSQPCLRSHAPILAAPQIAPALRTDIK